MAKKLFVVLLAVCALFGTTMALAANMPVEETKPVEEAAQTVVTTTTTAAEPVVEQAATTVSEPATAYQEPAQTSEPVQSQNPFSTNTDLENRWNLGVICSAVFPSEHEFKTGFNVDAVLSYDIFKFLALGVEMGYTGWEIHDQGIDIGRFNAMPLLFDVILKAPIEMDKYTVVPYLVNGFGILYSDVDEDGDAESMGIEVDTDTSFLYKLGGGIDFYITEMLALTFETSYQWSAVEFSASQNGVGLGSEDHDVNAYYLGGGIRLRF